jgi:Cof subfamily protein (haloacid dehalogenase superfamily)
MTAQRPVRPAFVPDSGAQTVVDLGDLTTRLDGWRPRLVASDLDGTLLTSSGEVSARTRAAIDACRAAGIPVVGVTGRGPRLLDSVRAALGGQGIAVLAQGGYVVDFGEHGDRTEVLRTVGMSRDDATAVIASIEEVTGELIVAVEDAAEQAEALRPLRVQHGFDWPYPEPAHLLPRHEVLPVGAVLKVFLRSSRLGEDELLQRARGVVDPAVAELTHAGLGFIEVLPPGVTKATGLAIALEHHGVGFGDVLVFGDMPNDLPMIEAVTAAGGRAVAMANAHPEVLAAAAERTSGSDADGVARYLEAVLELGSAGV